MPSRLRRPAQPVACPAAERRFRLPAEDARKEIALQLVTATLAQGIGLGVRLDPFRAGPQAQGMAEPEHGIDDRGITRILTHVTDKGAVDLDLVERERAQATQAG
jgi:hypothetical protein